ncbi:MAG: hypothetical protein HC925_06200 [Coleofasciculaceae cyanobacterium SM2_3_26]|nr:hypothetical protein [Coleofasciculaceae cyanobacterium SM2_3_26]
MPSSKFLKQVLTILQEGLGSKEHQAFVARLEGAIAPKDPETPSITPSI